MESNARNLENPGPRSLERIAFVAMATLTLAPILVQALWAVAIALTGQHCDALGLSLAALLVTTSSVTVQAIGKRRSFWTSFLVAAGLGMGLGLLMGDGGPNRLALGLTLLILGGGISLVVAALVRRMPLDVDGLARIHKVKAGLLILLSLFSIFQTTKLSAFMGDAKRMELSMIPQLNFLKNHSCFSSYYHALQLAQAGEPNLYDSKHWPDELELSTKREVSLNDSGPYAPFYLDNYMYPPQFLLLTGALSCVSKDFLVQRTLWFAFCGLFLALGFWIVAQWVGVQGKRHALWLIPLLWSAMVTLVTLQVGNVHHVVMVMAVLAMVAFELKKGAWGGALLAFSILAKISPGILVIVLLAQGRWRDLGWTLAFGVLYTLLTLVIFGVEPIESFLSYQLPRILSGESVQWFSNLPSNVVTNTGPFGIPFKLSALGLSIDNAWAVGRIVNTCYTLLIVVGTVVLSRQSRNRRQSLYLWIAVLMLSSLQSPFSPGYVVMPVLWLLTLLACEVKTGKGVLAFVLVWIAIAFPAPLPAGIDLVVSLLQQGLVFGVIVYAVLRKAQAAPGLASHA